MLGKGGQFGVPLSLHSRLPHYILLFLYFLLLPLFELGSRDDKLIGVVQNIFRYFVAGAESP